MAVAAIANNQALCVVTLSSLGDMVLRVGDHDNKKIWGGRVQQGFAGTPVAQLQKALIDVGVLKGKADGQFGGHTSDALKRFQWYLRTMSYRLKVSTPGLPSSGVISPFSGKSLGTPGACSADVATELVSWQRQGFVTTTPLVRLGLGALSNIQVSDGFKLLDYPGATRGEVLVHADFADVISVIFNSKAKTDKVTLLINQTFRRDDVPPSGAVVSPAKNSQHLVGHAVDLNIKDGDTVNTFDDFDNGDQSKAAGQFVSDIKSAGGIRWGGDFAKKDYVHFDDYLNPSSEDYAMTFFFAQNSFHSRHPMRLV